MTRVALKTLVAGGVVYFAGDPVPDDVAVGITAAGALGDDANEPHPTPADPAGDRASIPPKETEDGKTIEDLNAQIEALQADNDALRGQAAAAPDNGNGADENRKPTATVDYDDLDLEALKVEIDRRNEDRDAEAKVSKRGGKDTLAAALRADDEAAES